MRQNLWELLKISKERSYKILWVLGQLGIKFLSFGLSSTFCENGTTG
ncbi:hypothetical protein LEP1GSC021_2843 [Leptospira noguchii str. 1993005606]|nr:hypothetical protein LEP1GSC072_2004 [Leptospira noguchii str. Bonito]EMO26900.1 hypothetical protein LEP1GSC170_2247 [Leptospira interrogans serovar Bataviae str. HAI135]EPE85045.1 hypothetical protein LEP1GSC021_2843 [Leptospira noguchii str. 1993005606]